MKTDYIPTSRAFRPFVLSALLFVALTLGCLGAAASIVLPLLKSFGFTNQLEFLPSANLLLASDGMLYGETYSGGPSNCGCIFKVATNGAGYTVLHYFVGGDGANPEGGLLEGSDGCLYGSTYNGGVYKLGCIFRLNKDGSSYSTLKNFTGTGGDGANPSAALLEATNGLLYGTAYCGGAYTNGNIFSINKNGSGYALLLSFTHTNGANPSTALLQGSDGRLYGVTDSGGTWTNGTVFALSLDGTGFTNLWQFTGTNGDGGNPFSSVIEGNDGALYGTTYLGGVSNAGTVYKLGKDGSGYSVLLSFSGVAAGDGENPFASLKLGGDGVLYGTTQLGGTNGGGTVFKLNPDGGGYAVVHHFTGASGEGRYPQSALVETADGPLYGTTASGGNGEGGTLFKLDKDASGFTTIKGFYIFSGGDGFYPADPLLAGSDGGLYGTTVKGGEYNAGTVFKISADGSAYQLLYSFGASPGDGTDPRGGLVECLDGRLYGATYSGGASNAGTIYCLNKDGTDHGVLLSFGSNTNDARAPYGGLLQAGDGRLYGTTVLGGTNLAGTVFRITTNGTAYAILRSLGGTANSPTNPYCRLIEYPTGTLYGTSAYGGTNKMGAVFRLNEDGSGLAMLRSFNQDTNGWRPLAGVTRASDGMLYGTTYLSSGTANAGTLYRIATNGTSFGVVQILSLGICRAAVLEAIDGTLYGIACGTGSQGYGAIFSSQKDGTSFATSRTFGSTSGDGLFPKSRLMQAGDGSIFGTTGAGGSGWGTVYVQPQRPFVLAQPQTQVLLAGESALLSIAAAGCPAPACQWLFNGSALGNATNGVLSLNPVNLAQAGSYQVIISNTVGSVTSAVVLVSAYDFNWGTNESCFTVAGALGSGYRIDYLDNLAASWNPLTNFTLTTSPCQISDPDSGTLPQRFYRLVRLP